MDETIIYAKQIYIFWTNINEYFIEYCFNQMDFNIFLNLYPEIFRPYIFKILNYIKNKKIKNECKSVIIYTNNQCGSSWVNYIKNYLEYKINYPFFFVNESFVVHPWRRRKAFKNFIVILKSQKYFYEKFKQKNTFQFRIKRIKIFVGSLFSNFKELAQFKFKGWECYIEKMIFNFIMIFI